MHNKDMAMPLNLQFFAAGEGTGGEEGTGAGGTGGESGNGTGAGGTVDNTNVGGEGNKGGEEDKGSNPTPNPTQDLDKLRAQWIKEYEDKKQAEADEAAKLKRMNEQEKREYLFQKEKEEFEKQRKEFQRQTLQLQTQKILVEKGISGDLAKFIPGETAEEVKGNIDTFAKAFSDAVAVEIDNRIRKGAGSIHGSGGGTGRTGGNAEIDAEYKAYMDNYRKNHNITI